MCSNEFELIYHGQELKPSLQCEKIAVKAEIAHLQKL